jgi:hypothetical protein
MPTKGWRKRQIMQWIPNEKKEPPDATFDGQVTEVYVIDGHALPPSAILKSLTQRQWVGLTDEDMAEPRTHNFDFIDGARWAEAKLREKNEAHVASSDTSQERVAETAKQRHEQGVATIRALTDQIAALVWERDELRKQVQRYEAHGVTCQTYQHRITSTCSECNVHEDYTSPPQREWVGLTHEEIAVWNIFGNESLRVVQAIEVKLKEKNT